MSKSNSDAAYFAERGLKRATIALAPSVISWISSKAKATGASQGDVVSALTALGQTHQADFELAIKELLAQRVDRRLKENRAPRELTVDELSATFDRLSDEDRTALLAKLGVPS